MKDAIFLVSIVIAALGFICFLFNIRDRIHKQNENNKLFK